MRIALVSAAPISYNPIWFLRTAFERLYHEVYVFDQITFLESRPEDADLFVGVDSGGPLNIPPEFYSKFVMWFIDSRRNHKPEIRTPNDDEVAIQILSGGGWVMQAQMNDAIRLSNVTGALYDNHLSFLPLAADPEVWSNKPQEEKIYKAAFVGNCYDTARLRTLERLSASELLHWPGIEGAIMEDGAAVYRKAAAGVNIPSWWGTPECYDINMRVFEVMSTGTLLITNHLKELQTLGMEVNRHLITYRSLDEIPMIIEHVWQEHKRAEVAGEESVYGLIGKAGRELILDKHTYTHRARSIIYRTVGEGI